MTSRKTVQTASPIRPRFIGRQLALGFGSVSVVAVAMCAMLVAVIQDVGGLVESMRHDESSIRQGMDLSAAVREMSLHSAHTVIEGDASHLGHYNASRDQVRARIQTLAARIPPEQQARLDILGQTTQAMHELLITVALPAAKRGATEAARTAHQKLERLGREAAGHADVLANATTLQMSHAHDHATRATRIGLLGGGLCALLIVGLSVGFTLRLRAVVIRPLQLLTDAALRYGRGDFAFRAGRVGEGELAAVGEAFARMADELAVREARLLHSERMAAIGQLAAGIAHELNNPIGIIRGYLKTMSPEDDPEALRDELSILDEEAGHCQRITEDLLTYASSGQLHCERIRMDEFLREAATRHEVASDATNVEVLAEDQLVEADPARLRQVILNLLNNAIQVATDDGPVTLTGSVEDDGYRIAVTDRGPGVAEGDRQRIFEPFFSTRKGGSGLGLAVCQGIIRAHGGTIEVADAEGGGAVFRLWIPLARRTQGPSNEGTADREART